MDIKVDIKSLVNFRKAPKKRMVLVRVEEHLYQTYKAYMKKYKIPRISVLINETLRGSIKFVEQRKYFKENNDV